MKSKLKNNLKRMKNYKTTLGAAVTVASYLLPLFGVPLSPAVQGAVMTLGIAIIGLFGKDSNVTGGTKAQTREARWRAKNEEV